MFLILSNFITRWNCIRRLNNLTHTIPDQHTFSTMHVSNNYPTLRCVSERNALHFFYKSLFLISFGPYDQTIFILKAGLCTWHVDLMWNYLFSHSFIAGIGIGNENALQVPLLYWRTNRTSLCVLVRYLDVAKVSLNLFENTSLHDMDVGVTRQLLPKTSLTFDFVWPLRPLT